MKTIVGLGNESSIGDFFIGELPVSWLDDLDDCSLYLRNVVIITDLEKSTEALESFPLEIDFTVEDADEKLEVFVVPVSFNFFLSFQTAVKLGFEDITAKVFRKPRLQK